MVEGWRPPWGGSGEQGRNGTSGEQGTSSVREATQGRKEGRKRESKTAGGERETFYGGRDESEKMRELRERKRYGKRGTFIPCPTEKGMVKFKLIGKMNSNDIKRGDGGVLPDSWAALANVSITFSQLSSCLRTPLPKVALTVSSSFSGFKASTNSFADSAM